MKMLGEPRTPERNLEKPATPCLGGFCSKEAFAPFGGSSSSHKKKTLLPGTLTVLWCYRVSAEGTRPARALTEPLGEVLGYALCWRNHTLGAGPVGEGEISHLSWRETLGLLDTIQPKLQKEWDWRDDVHSFFCKGFLVNSLLSGLNGKGEAPV